VNLLIGIVIIKEYLITMIELPAKGLMGVKYHNNIVNNIDTIDISLRLSK